MKTLGLIMMVSIVLLTGCESNEAKAIKKSKHLASLTCDSPREGRTQEELRAIGDDCFRGGSYSKSSGIKW